MAARLPAVSNAETPAGLVGLLVSRPHPDLCTKAGDFSSYRKKGKWAAAAKQAGLSKADADRLNDAAEDFFDACCAAWTALLQSASGQVLAALIDEARPMLDRYREHKRASAQLDFDDLIYAARDLLSDHEAVRRALGQRYAKVLVDEFQDTDPLQAEIFWRLCGDPVEDPRDWVSFRIRPGALFLVGDPKQAIYRFRGADVGAYVQARAAFSVQDADGLVSISTNPGPAPRSSRSSTSAEAILSADGQRLHRTRSFHDDRGGVVLPRSTSRRRREWRASAEQQRDAGRRGG
jgi:exodeoxyribonuclease-5